MQDLANDQITVSIVMLKQASTHPWGSAVWSLLGLLPGLSEAELSLAQDKGDIHYFPDFSVQLHPLHSDSYYHNLMSGKPKIYVISPQEEDTPQPFLVTVDYDEAASYMETGEQIFNAPLPSALCDWVEQFVLTHYQPEKPKKRRRKKWHDQAEKR